MKQFMPMIIALGACLFTAALSAWKADRRVNVPYKMSDNPNTCQYPAPLPSNCNTNPSGTICKLTVSPGVDRTYYQDAFCTTTFYKQF